eukprot:1939899-Rhodomonas_salina.1
MDAPHRCLGRRWCRSELRAEAGRTIARVSAREHARLAQTGPDTLGCPLLTQEFLRNEQPHR